MLSMPPLLWVSSSGYSAAHPSTNSPALMGQLVDYHCHGQNNDIVLAGCDLHAIAVTQAEPLLGDLRYFVVALTDGVLVVQDIAVDLQLGAVLDVDRKAVTQRGNQGFFDHGQ